MGGFGAESCPGNVKSDGTAGWPQNRRNGDTTRFYGEVHLPSECTECRVGVFGAVIGG
jgi:hypothetical protein